MCSFGYEQTSLHAETHILKTKKGTNMTFIIMSENDLLSMRHLLNSWHSDRKKEALKNGKQQVKVSQEQRSYSMSRVPYVSVRLKTDAATTVIATTS